jgi:hypothetical protein
MCSTPRIILQIELAVENDHALGDVLGEIADPLKVVGDAKRADDIAQVDRHRLAPRNGEDRFFFDLALQEVDLGVLRDDGLGQDRVVAVERIDGVADLALGETAHFGDHARQLLEIGVERLMRVLRQHHLLSRSCLSLIGASSSLTDICLALMRARRSRARRPQKARAAPSM